jgi:hypothetical protein
VDTIHSDPHHLDGIPHIFRRLLHNERAHHLLWHSSYDRRQRGLVRRYVRRIPD